MLVRPEEMPSLLASYRKRAAKVRRDCEKSVVEWRLATDQMLRPDPLHALADRGLEWVHGWRMPKRQWLKADGSKPGRKHGLDAAGQLRIYDDFRYYVYSDGWIDEVVFLDDGKVDLTRFALGPGGKVIASYEMQSSGETSFQEEVFTWKKAVVTKMSQRTWLPEEGQLVETRHPKTYHLTYDSDGTLRKAVRELMGGKRVISSVVFARPGGASLPKTLKAVEDYFVEHIPKAIAEAKVASPLYVALLTYCGEDITSGWPQDIELRTATHRDKCLKLSDREQAMYRLWCPAEEIAGGKTVGGAEKKSLSELEEKTQQLLQLAGESESFDYDELRRLFCRVAMRLNKLDWRKIARVTDEFIVLPADDHGETDFFEELRASVPAKKIALLRRRGMFPVWETD